MNTLVDRVIKEETDIDYLNNPGAGGQRRDKKLTKIRINFDVNKSKLFSEEQKRKLLESSGKNGIISIINGDQTSQTQNLKKAIENFKNFIIEALKEEKERIPTKVPKSENEKRLQEKKKNRHKKSEKKN